MLPQQSDWNTQAKAPDLAALRSLAAEVGQALLQRRLTLGMAESCTGGLVSSLLTDIPGSSDYFLGGVVSYAYSAKERALGVSHDTLTKLGAVCPETALAMAEGVRRLLGCDIGVSVTGVAGPGGGTPDKPVGLVYLHLSMPDREIPARHIWAGDRLANKALSAEAALKLVLKALAAKD
jgi:PncC family amidohydrolase